MNTLPYLIFGLLAATFTARTRAQDKPAEAGKATDVWFADFDKAVAAAAEQKKDLLVDFTGSDWCGWCIRLHEEVFAHQSFLDGAQKNFVLVALDYPQSEEAKAKVPNEARNKELAEKYGIRGFPTILLMTPAGEVFGKTGYLPGGPDKYLESVNAMRDKGKRLMQEIASLQSAFDKAAGKDRDAVVATAVTLLGTMTSEDVGADKVATIAKGALGSTDAAVLERVVTALVKAGQADEATKAKALELDPKNAKGLYEIVLQGRMEGVTDDTGARAFLADLDKLMEFGGKDRQRVELMVFTAMRWSAGPLSDMDAAKKWANVLKKHVEGSPQAENYKAMIEQVLGS